MELREGLGDQSPFLQTRSEESFVPKRALQGPVECQPSFSLKLLKLEGNTGRTRKGIVLDREVNHKLVREIQFGGGGTWFQL